MYFLGIEIGGTKLQIGAGQADGHLAGLWRGTVDVAAGTVLAPRARTEQRGMRDATRPQRGFVGA